MEHFKGEMGDFPAILLSRKKKAITETSTLRALERSEGKTHLHFDQEKKKLPRVEKIGQD